MPRKKPLPDQFTASLLLLCKCGHEFSKEQKWLRNQDRILCPRCDAVVASSREDILRLRSEQVKWITDAVGRMRGV